MLCSQPFGSLPSSVGFVGDSSLLAAVFRQEDSKMLALAKIPAVARAQLSFAACNRYSFNSNVLSPVLWTRIPVESVSSNFVNTDPVMRGIKT